jgi:pimeloyl-ACP methyl ester carboxylesterase
MAVVNRAPGTAGVSGSTRERSMNVSGIRIHVRSSGTGEGPPLLLINGIGAHMDMWASLQRALPETRLIAFDAPGTGRSATPPLPLSFDRLADLTERLIDRLGHERVDVLGYSFGGLVAQFLCRRAPERVRRVVLAATAPGWGGVPGSVWTLAQMSTPLRYYWRPYYDGVIGGLMGGRARSDPDFVRRHGDARQRYPPTPLGYLWQLAALAAGPGTLHWLSEITAPTLVVAGDDDPVMPLGNAMLLGRHLPNARLLVAPGEGHLLLMDDDSAVLPAIGDFLAAGDPEESDAWRTATVVDDATLRRALAHDAPSLANPWAMMSAAVRAVSRWPPPAPPR